jgi:hypothetical protein
VDHQTAVEAEALEGEPKATAIDTQSPRLLKPDAKPKAGQWRRVALSPRDWELLSWASEQKFLSYEQVARFFPDGMANPRRPPTKTPTPDTVRRRRRPGNWYLQERLRKLVHFDVLRRVPVYTEAAAVLVPGQVGHDLLEGTGRSHGLPRSGGIDWKNYLHDKAATDIRWLLEKSFGASKWRSERVLRAELNTRLVPDALVEIGGRNVAVEAELTRKSLARYLAIFHRYLHWQEPSLSMVLYVVPNSLDLNHFFTVVLPAVVAKKELWGIRKPDLSLFRFTSVAKLAERRVWWTTSNPTAPTEGSL